MVGPAVLAARGVDIAAMVADLAREPEGVIPTEWFVNRRNGLKIGADYLVGLGLFEAAGSRARVAALDAILLGLPSQPAGNGRGLAYAYRRTPGAGAWEPAEGVPTGWGWNTQRGTSRIAADYLLVSLAHGHDPVAGKRNGRPLRWRPQAPATTAPAAAPGTGSPTVPAAPAALQGTLSHGRRNRPQAIVCVSRASPSKIAFGRPSSAVCFAIRHLAPTIQKAQHQRSSLNRAKGTGGGSRCLLQDSTNSKIISSAAVSEASLSLRSRQSAYGIASRNSDSSTESSRVIVRASSGRRDVRSVGMYHYILINPSNDFEITERFFHLTAAERARALMETPAGPLSEGYARKLSYEDWARTRPDVKAGVPLFSRASGFFHKVSREGLILARTAFFVTVDPKTGELTDASWQSVKETNRYKIAYKRPISRKEYASFQHDQRPPQVTRRLGLVAEPNGGYLEWTMLFDFERELAVDVRALNSVSQPVEDGDRVIMAPSQKALQSRALLINSYLVSQGYFSGMVLGPRPDATRPIFRIAHVGRAGSISAQLSSASDDKIGHTSKRSQDCASTRADETTRRRLDEAFDRGERVLNWLADLESHLKRRQERPRVRGRAIARTNQAGTVQLLGRPGQRLPADHRQARV